MSHHLINMSDRNRDPFNWLRQEVDQLFQNMWPVTGKLSDQLSPQRGFSVLPHVDVAENEKEFKVTADVPGLEDENLKVKFSNKILTIRGEKKLQREEKEHNYYITERWGGSFSRSIQIPVPIREELIQAHVKDGVLYITLPKAEDSAKQVKSIEVKKI